MNRRLRFWFDRLFRRSQLDREMDEEIGLHIELRAAELQQAGLSREQARRRAHLEFGGAENYKEQCRETRRFHLLHDFVADLRYGLRMLRKAPGFTAVAVLTLALGIGANTAVFSLVNAVLLRMLPYPHAERLVTLETVSPHGEISSVGRDDFLDWHVQNRVFEQMAYTSFSQGMLGAGGGEPERVIGTEVSDGFFQTLDVQPMLGRWFLPDDQKEGHNRVIILSYGNWVRRFGGRKDLVGQPVTLGRQIFSVIGIMPQSFRFDEGLHHLCEYWVPMQHQSPGRYSHQYSAYARLKPGVGVEAAQAEMTAIAQRLGQAYPDTNGGWGIKVTSMEDQFQKELGPPLLIFLVAVALVLLIACANVANLLLARATARSREMAIRTALGAGRLSIICLLLTETVLLSLTGAAVGLLLAQWGIDLAGSMTPPELDFKSILYIDRNVLAFTLALSVLTGILTGLAPALAASRTATGETLKQGGAGAGVGVQRSRAFAGLVVSEVAMAVMLLIASGLLLKSFVRLLDVNLGFRSDHLLTVRMGIPGASYPEDYQKVAFYRDLINGIRNLPGVLSAGATMAMPLGGQYSGGGLEIEGRPQPRDWTERMTAYHIVTPGYFSTMGIPLLRGRDFDEQDRKGSEPVAIVNEVLAHRYFGDEDPLGKKIRAGQGHSTEPWQTIVGVVGDVRHRRPEREPGPEFYSPHAQVASGYMFLMVRTAVPPASLVGAVRSEIRAMERNATILEIRSMEQAVGAAVAPRRLLMHVVGFFSLVALGLAALGLAAMMWYSVSRRTHEIGVRMALGARQSDMLRLVLWRGLRLTFPGVAIGLAAAFGLTRYLATVLFGVNPKDPLVFAVVPLVLATVGMAATYLPARRAAKVDPVVALRCE